MIVVHVVSVLVCVVVGLTIALLRKGTARHREFGRVYTISLAATVATSFGIYEVRDGSVSVFHVVSLLVSVVVVAAIVALRRGYVWLHAQLMLSSLLIVGITGVAQFFDHLPFQSDAANAIVFLHVPSILGFTLIWRETMKLRSTDV